MPVAAQPCDMLECIESAAYRTRENPAYCVAHVTESIRAGGLEPLEPFAKVAAGMLTECIRCNRRSSQCSRSRFL